MTNRYHAFPQPVPGGFKCMMRFARDARPNPVMEGGEKPKVLDTEGAAWKEIALHLLSFMNGAQIRGERFDAGGSIKEARRVAADKIFRGGGSVIEVERKGASA